MKLWIKTIALLLLVLMTLNGVPWADTQAVHGTPRAISQATPEGLDFFEKHIRPVLVERCYMCHSDMTKKPMSNFRLDSRESMLAGGDHGVDLVPGEPENSRLIRAIRYKDKELKMPPDGPLPPEQVANFEAWVKMGAPDPRNQPMAQTRLSTIDFTEARKFWSFRPVTEPPAPAVRNKSWPVNAVDHFILAQQEAKGLTPARAADKRTLIRRATFDLIGLPPTPEEVKAFLEDKSSNAYEKVIDRLLASPHYGERWGRHWLDLVRYADTSGCNADFPVPSAYRYRDYVINSFNQDKPYDQFLREQIAGDLLPSKSEAQKVEHVIATGYLAIARRFGSRAGEFHLTIEDTIDNVGKGMLGLSISCARCHDHKYDPIPTRDYYALYGIFNSTKYAFPGTEIFRHTKDFVPIGTPAQAGALQKYETEVAALDDRIEKLTQEKGPLQAKPKIGMPTAASAAPFISPLISPRTLVEVEADLERARNQLRNLEAKWVVVPKAYAVSEGKSSNAKIQRKGDPKNTGDEVPRGFLHVLGGQQLPKDATGSGRYELAQWITDSKNPLTARVMVNRIWQHHFGRGIVKTPNDFGVRGEPPTHPALLDYLAVRFMQGGWSIKAMHKLIMLSHSYQLASDENSRNAAVDPNNDLLWRFNPRRLSAEEIRDAILFVSGTLDLKIGGEHPFPREPEWHYTQHKPFIAVYEDTHRSIYLMQQRIKKQPFLEIFDGADTNTTTPLRPLTTTPIQALFVLNAPFMHDLADKLAVRIGMAFPKEEKQIDYAYQLAYGRPARRDEIRLGRDYLRSCREKMKNIGLPWDHQARAALASYTRMLLGSNEFFYVE